MTCLLFFYIKFILNKIFINYKIYNFFLYIKVIIYFMEILEGSIIKKYKFKHFIGKGNFGAVWAAHHIENNQQVAIKIVNKDLFKEHPKFEKYLRTEMKYLPKINHENIVKFIEFFENQYSLYFVLEYCNNGDLGQYLKEKMRIPEPEALEYLKQLISAFQVLNSHKIMHRDLKLENILLKLTDDKIVIKLCDFDFLKKGDTGKTYLGTGMYMAPEILKSSKSYTNKADLWSLGVVFYKILYGDYPFKGKTENMLIKNIELMKVDYKEEFGISKFSINLMEEIFQCDPDNRISWEKVYEMFNLPNIAITDAEKKKDLNGYYLINTTLSNEEYGELKEPYRKNEKVEDENKICLWFRSLC